LYVENWRNFTRIDVALPSRVIFVGPNASGKSNLLDIFRFLRDIASPVGGGLQEAVGRRGGISALRCLAARQEPDITIRVALGNGTLSDEWTYELTLTADKKKKATLVQREVVLHQGAALLNRPDDKDRSDPDQLTQTHLEQVNVNKPFRAIAEFFAEVRYLHIVPQIVREPDRAKGREDDPYGGDFLKRVAKAPSRTRVARLRRIAEALRVALPQLLKLELWKDVEGRPHLRGKYEHWRPQGAWQSEEQFSDGTLRLLGLLWALLEGAGPLLLEEPELSLHPGVVRHLPQMFARIQNRTGRQILISSHSSDLLGDPGIGLDEVLMLLPEGEGSAVRPAKDIREIPILLEAGHTMAEAVMPRTEPPRAAQLSLFEGLK
jgi:predicted ATPase